MRSLLLAAIHNGELQNSPAQEILDLLVDEEFAQGVIEITEQPPLADEVDRVELRRWRRHQRQLEGRWRDYIGRASIGRDVAASLNQLAYRHYLLSSNEFREKQWRQRQIERFVTAKHIRSWTQFLDSKAKTLVVLESDAVKTPDFIRSLDCVLSRIAETVPTYVNLAGGLDPRELGIEGFVTGRANGMATFSKPVTNTSCAYALNRRLAELMINFVSDTPESRELGIDWLFNAFFLEAKSDGEYVACLHADPPVLLHGSLEGITSSWHPDR